VNTVSQPKINIVDFLLFSSRDKQIKHATGRPSEGSERLVLADKVSEAMLGRKRHVVT
jgi:hypothetical protein